LSFALVLSQASREEEKADETQEEEDDEAEEELDVAFASVEDIRLERRKPKIAKPIFQPFKTKTSPSRSISRPSHHHLHLLREALASAYGSKNFFFPR
jgi:hypothetical protein